MFTDPGGRAMRQSDASYFSLHRLESLTDGIYAIAMTLLVLSLPLPQVNGTSVDNDILAHLGKHANLFGSYALSFMLLGSFWVVQLKIFKYIKSSCVPHIWGNLIGLLVVCLIPFTSSMMGYHNHTFTANLMFHMNILLVSLLFIYQGAILLKYPEIIADGHDIASVKRIIRINMVLPFVSVSGIAVSFFSPEFSTLVYISVPLMVNRLRTKLHGGSDL